MQNKILCGILAFMFKKFPGWGMPPDLLVLPALLYTGLNPGLLEGGLTKGRNGWRCTPGMLSLNIIAKIPHT